MEASARKLFQYSMVGRKRIIITILLCLIIGFALRFYAFDQKSLWMDEIYTFNDSRDHFRVQLNYYKQNPTYLHPPLFFILTHLFYPFTKPERDLRIIPLVFGTLSIPLMYFLSKFFSPHIALPCTLSLTFMVYHISLSQDARFYTFLMFCGMAGLYFFMKHLKTLRREYLFFVALSFAIPFYTHYSVIPFIVLSQLLWFYRIDERDIPPRLYRVSILSGLLFLMCLPWVAFVAFNSKRSILETGLVGPQETVSFWNLLYQTFHDWLPNAPLMVGSAILLMLLPFFSKNKKNGLILLLLFLLPTGGVYLFCKLFHVVHFVTSRYFICFLPLFIIAIFFSLDAIEAKCQRLKRLKVIFLIFFVASNLVMLPLYYRSEKQDYRGLVTYLKGQLRDGDKIVVGNGVYIGMMLHYFGVYPEGRHYVIPAWKVSNKEIENRFLLVHGGAKFTILCSQSHWFKYFGDGSRLWIVADKENAKIIKQRLSSGVLKGYFDGSFSCLKKFPEDGSIYLFLWDPKSPGEKGIDLPIE
jgi:hypothetical protein